MSARDAVFQSFLSEMRGYVADLRRDAGVLAAPTRFGGLAHEALFTVRRVGHTIAGLAQHAQLDDLVAVGVALNDTMAAQIGADHMPSGAIVAPLTRLAVYLETRLDTMATHGGYLPASAGEAAEAERVIMAVRAFAAGLTATRYETPAPPASGASAANDDLAALPLAVRAEIEAFMRADLRRDSVEDRPPAASRPRPLTRPPPDAEGIEAFAQELSDDLLIMRRAVVDLQRGSDMEGALETLRLVAHRLCGTAFSVGVVSVGAIGDLMEPMLNALTHHEIAFTDAAQWWLVASVNALETARDRLVERGGDSDAADLLAELHESYATVLAEAADPGVISRPSAAPRGPNLADAPRSAPSVRVGMRQMDRLMATLTALQLNRADLARLHALGPRGESDLARVVDRLGLLSDQLRLERAGLNRRPAAASGAADRAIPGDQSEFDLMMASLSEMVADLRSLATGLSATLVQLHQRGEQQQTLIDQALRDVLGLRLAPVAETTSRLQLVAASAALAEGKAVALVVEGEHVELDREIAMVVFDALEHLVRNAVAHGVEAPAAREAAGKPATATVRITARSIGDEVEITVADDGQGIDVAALTRAARQVGALGPDEQVAPEAAFALLFLPEVSTADAVSPTAGRGMGMPTVKRAMDRARGAITIASTPGSGTIFSLRVPISRGVLHGFVVLAGGGKYALPIATLRGLSQVDPAAIHFDERGAWASVPTLLGEERPLPIATLMDALGHPDVPATSGTVVVVASDGAEYALLVDDVLEERERMVARATPDFLRMRGAPGATIDDRGDLVLILDLPEIVGAAARRGTFAQRPPVVRGDGGRATTGSHILVVDDSPSIQFGIGTTLRAAGFEVEAARDGNEALERASQSLPRVMLLDVEMPRLDGFEVLRQLHADPRLRAIPVIMLTSRAAPRFRDHALKLGAADYLVKPVGADQLLAAIASALASRAPGKDVPI